MRAILAASATTAVLGCARASSPRSQAPSRVSLFLQRRHGSPGALDQHLAQVLAAALGDAERWVCHRLSPDGAQTEPRGEIATAGEGTRIADGRDERGCV